MADEKTPRRQAQFWFVHARVGREDVALAVAAFTERSARVQARKTLGADSEIEGVTAVPYAHAWVVNLGWQSRLSLSALAKADASVEDVGER